jgi:hypothetical protein
VDGPYCTITVHYDPPLLQYTLVDGFMNDSEWKDNNDAWDIGIYTELCIRGRISLSPAFIPSIEVSIYPSLEAPTPFSESELSSIGVRMETEYRARIWSGDLFFAFAERVGPAARRGVLEALDQTYVHSRWEPIVHPEPVLPPGWERRLSDAHKSYFIHPESGETSLFPPPFEPTFDRIGEFYYPIFAFVAIDLQEILQHMLIITMKQIKKKGSLTMTEIMMLVSAMTVSNAH